MSRQNCMANTERSDPTAGRHGVHSRKTRPGAVHQFTSKLLSLRSIALGTGYGHGAYIVRKHPLPFLLPVQCRPVCLGGREAAATLQKGQVKRCHADCNRGGGQQRTLHETRGTSRAPPHAGSRAAAHAQPRPGLLPQLTPRPPLHLRGSACRSRPWWAPRTQKKMTFEKACG